MAVLARYAPAQRRCQGPCAAPGAVVVLGLLLILIAAAAPLPVATAAADQQLADARHDPLHLRLWASVDPLPENLLGGLLQQALPSSAASLMSARSVLQQQEGQQQHARINGGGGRGWRRRLLRPTRITGEVPADAPPGAPTGASTTAWATAFVTPGPVSGGSGARVPRSFLGISHEWTDAHELGQQGSFLRLIGDLSAYGGGPIVLRVGGGSTDFQLDVPPAATWQALRELRAATGAALILGLNFHAANATLTAAQRAAAEAALGGGVPNGTVASFELGNEPNYYADRPGGADRYVACCFVNEWGALVRNVSCPLGVDASCVRGQFAGPAWGHISMTPASLDWFLRLNSQWMNLATVHWYKATRESGPTVENLLDEAPLQADAASLRALVGVARRRGLPLRIAEMNSISNSGARGVSNSLSAALWTLDAMLEAAAAGAAGVNLHWGNGGALYAAVLRQPGGKTIVKPSYYAYLMFQMAVGSGSSFVGGGTRVEATPGARLKVWVLADDATGALRVVLLNKSPGEAGGVVVRLPDGGAFARAGKLLRLLGRSGQLSEEWNVSLGNMTYAIGGAPFGTPAGEAIAQVSETVSVSAPPSPQDQQQDQQGQQGQQGQGGATTFTAAYVVSMPPASAALLTIPRA